MCYFLLQFFLTNTLYAFLLSLARAVHLVHLIFLDSIIVIVFGEPYKLRCSTACSSLNLPSFSLLSPNILLIILLFFS
jgi:hypothetical protein